MNKSLIIKIAVIVVAFGASGFILYNGFFKGNGSGAVQTLPGVQTTAGTPAMPAAPGTSGATAAAPGTAPVAIPGTPVSSGATQAAPTAGIGDILPNGGTLDFDKVINTSRFQFGLVTYPVLDPNSEVGVSEESLIILKPVSGSQTAKP